jgi:cytoskeletal protein RodZ
MHPLNKGFLYTTCCALALGLPANCLAQEEVAAPRNSQSIASSELPDSPGTAWSKAQDASTQQSSSSHTASPASGQTATSQTAPTQDEGQKPQRPVGTAAAEAPKAKGVTAAQPAGIAIAPAKQRRVRTIVIKVGAMAAAGAAVGTVIGLTRATPSRPPGAH